MNLLAYIEVIMAAKRATALQDVAMLYGILFPAITVSAMLAGLNLGFWLERRRSAQPTA